MLLTPPPGLNGCPSWILDPDPSPLCAANLLATTMLSSNGTQAHQAKLTHFNEIVRRPLVAHPPIPPERGSENTRVRGITAAAADTENGHVVLRHEYECSDFSVFKWIFYPFDFCVRNFDSGLRFLTWMEFFLGVPFFALAPRFVDFCGWAW